MKNPSAEIKAFIFGMLGVTAALVAILFLSYGNRTPEAFREVTARSSMLLTGSQNYANFDGGFIANITISLWAMAISIAGGLVLGAGLVSQVRPLRFASTLFMNFLRNSPWLVILYAMLYLIPFEIRIFGNDFVFSPTVKSIVGLSLPISANVAAVLLGGVQSIPRGQWEAAQALGYGHTRILAEVVIPQAIPLMIPSLMTVYASLFIGTSLVVVTGTNDVLSIAKVLIASGADAFSTAIYVFILFLFFAYAFPIAMATRWLERRVRL